MSEFISNCPKCRQQILCDTAYVGRRIACPVCLQEILMPEPNQRGAAAPAAQSAAPAQEPVTPAGAKGSNTALIAVIGGVVLVLVAAVVALALRKPATVTIQAPTPAASAPVAATAPSPAPAPAAPAAVPARVASIPTGMLGQCRAIWTFDQDRGDTVLDITGNGYNGRLVGDAPVWLKAESSDSTGLSLGGATSMEVDAPVVNTAQSFTVSSWVKLDVMEAKKPQTIISIDGATNSGFNLGFFPFSGATARGGRFELSRAEGDSKDAAVIRALTKYGVNTKTWYHVAGVFDAKAQTISLYLNGTLQTNMPCAGAWQATGKTAIGRGLWAGHPSHFFQGIVRDVRLYATALTEDQIKDISR